MQSPAAYTGTLVRVRGRGRNRGRGKGRVRGSPCSPRGVHGHLAGGSGTKLGVHLDPSTPRLELNACGIGLG